MTQLIILDRDGILNEDSLHYIKSPREFIFLPGSIEAIAHLTKAGYSIAIATNQSGISRGFYDEAQLNAIHAKLHTAVERQGGHIAKIIYCPHLPDAGCVCRKPQPGMLLTLAKHFNCSLADVAFVGDRVSDIQAAEAAGAKPIMVLSTMTDRVGLAAYPHVPVFASLLDYVNQLLSV